MGTIPKRAGEKDRRGLDARSVHGEYVEHNPEIRHPVRDGEKMMESTESDGLTESVKKESAEELPIMRGRPVRRAAKRELRKYKSMVRKLKERVNDKTTNPKVVKSKATTVVMSLAKLSPCPNERSWARGRCHARRQGKGEPSATDVTGGINLNGFKGQEKKGDPA